MSKGAVVVGVVVAVGAFFAAPAIAAVAGGMGILGAAGTGTLIGTLSGAALTSASLAAIGGSVVAGTAVITGVSGVGAACLVKYCQSVEKGDVENAQKNLSKFAESNPKEFRAAYKKYQGKMTEVERQLWEKYL